MVASLGASMGAKDDRLREAVQQYPCPWCSKHAGFGSGPARVSDWMSSPARGLVSFSHPKKGMDALFSPTILVHCLDCRQPVVACGHCDHPNRDAGINMACANCRKTISA